MRFHTWAGCALVILFLLGAAASTGPGVTWDEPAYVFAGYNYTQWVLHLSPGSFSAHGIDAYWQFNHEHPPAAKLLYGFAATVEGGEGFGTFLAARLGAVAMFVLLVGLVWCFTARSFGRPAGVIAALSLVLMPRVFGHGLLSALDLPVALACFAAAFAFSRAIQNKSRGVWAGVLWGVALLTKINAVFLPIVLIPWAVWYHRKRAVTPCATFLVVGVLTFFAGWPWLWHDTFGRVQQYAMNKTERLAQRDRPAGTANIPVYYLGTTYRQERAPWHYPFVMTLVTVPVALLVFAGIGVGKAARSGEGRRIGTLVMASGLLPLVVVALPMVPKYDGVRLFMPAFPFVACLAGAGGARLWDWRGRLGKVIVAALLALNAAALLSTHPYELSYYNCLVGGAWGANKLGFETTYWGDTVNQQVIKYVNQHCPDGSRVTSEPPHTELIGALPGLRSGLRWVPTWNRGRRNADFVILFPRQGHLSGAALELLKTGKPIKKWSYMGVPQCLLYRVTTEAQ